VSGNSISRPGRPRNPGTDRAIMDATVAVLIEAGYEAVTIEAVAVRAGVSRPTIYRRYADRVALVRAAAADAFVRVPQSAPAADPKTHVLRLLENTVEMLTQTPIGPTFRALIPHIARDPALGKLANELGKTRRVQLRAAMAAARAAGALPSTRDLDTVIDGLLGAIYFRFFITQRSLGPRYLSKLLKELA
jgi:AcrR family transcriptional regulator